MYTVSIFFLWEEWLKVSWGEIETEMGFIMRSLTSTDLRCSDVKRKTVERCNFILQTLIIIKKWSTDQIQWKRKYSEQGKVEN